jgi:D-proline reductase (dithiol) PrdB
LNALPAPAGEVEDIPVVRLADLPLKYRFLIGAYRWRRISPTPLAVPRRPLAEARVALVTTAGLVPPGAEPFDLDTRGGDPTFRVIPAETSPQALVVHHRSDAFDRTGLATDINVVFPVAVLASLAREGRIGAVAPQHLSFMGSITAPGRLVRDHAPRAAELFVEDRVDVALLVPV